jgi:hypothetical protein
LSAIGPKLASDICCVAFEPQPWKLKTSGTRVVPAYDVGTYSRYVRGLPL